MNEKKITFRMAEEKDAGLVMSFIHHLSVYEEMEGSVQATEELLRENLFRRGFICSCRWKRSGNGSVYCWVCRISGKTESVS